MTPVTQRTFGYPHGECVRAAYASLLDLPIESVPRFDPAALGAVPLLKAERSWLRSIGFDLVGFQASASCIGALGAAVPTAEDDLPAEVLECVPPVHHLLSGFSVRGFGHRCVGYGGKLAWDPHPSRAGLRTIYAVGFVVPC